MLVHAARGRVISVRLWCRSLTARSFSADAWRAKTLAVHAGEAPDPTTRASAPPIHMSTTFVVDELTSFSGTGVTNNSPFVYTRWNNPTVRQLEKKLMALEGAADCVAFGSGMGASSALLFSLLSAGDHVVVSDSQYPGVSELMRETLPRFGIHATPVDVSCIEEVKAAMRPETKLVWIETPCNPTLRLADIEAVAEVSRRGGSELVVDSTFATPIATQPLALGADFVVHSLTKYFCGHGDAVGGAVLARDAARASRLRTEGAIHFGGVLSPFNAWLISRGIATLPLRMRAHSDGALKVALWLEQHPRVVHVNYPGLAQHPQHALAQRQMRCYSGMLSFQLKGGAAAGEALARRMMDGGLKVIHYAVSLGHHRSLIYWMSTWDLAERDGSSFALSGDALANYRRLAGDGVFRMSVGLEDPEDLIQDLSNLLSEGLQDSLSSDASSVDTSESVRETGTVYTSQSDNKTETTDTSSDSDDSDSDTETVKAAYQDLAGRRIEFTDGDTHALLADPHYFHIPDKVVVVNRVGATGEFKGWLHITASEPHWAVEGEIPSGWIDPAKATFRVIPNDPSSE